VVTHIPPRPSLDAVSGLQFFGWPDFDEPTLGTQLQGRRGVQLPRRVREEWWLWMQPSAVPRRT
jgi:hypothetical protein